MKLRNKITGEIGTTDTIIPGFNSIKQLNEEWEDYKEEFTHWEPGPHKEYHFITSRGDINSSVYNNWDDDERISMGNCFKTKEEAERAVEKLKEIKKLRDSGLKLEELWDDYLEVSRERDELLERVEELEK